MCVNRCSGSVGCGVALAERRAGRIVVTMRGEHDMSTRDALWATMVGAIDLGDTDVVVDMSMVGFMGRVDDRGRPESSG